MASAAAKKILILSHEFPPLGGGGGRVMDLLCRELHKRGVGVDVWTNGVPSSMRISFPFKVRYFPTPRTAQFETNFPAIFVYLGQVLFSGLFVLRRRKYWLIFSNMVLPAGIVGHILSRIFRIPHVAWHHGTEVHGHGMGRDAPRVYKSTLKRIWRKAYANFFVSQSLLDRAQGIGGLSRASILPVAIKPPDTLIEKRSAGCQIFLFAGRLEPDKNVIILLEAVDILQRKNDCSMAVFHIAGDGAQSHMLRARASRFRKPEQVLFLGPVHPEKMKEVYTNAYAVVLPSYIEGYPLTILEASAYKVPTIGTDTEGIADAVTHGESGLLFTLNDAEGLAAAISRLSADPALRDRLGRAAFDRSRDFTVERVADTFIRAVSGILEKS